MAQAWEAAVLACLMLAVGLTGCLTGAPTSQADPAEPDPEPDSEANALLSQAPRPYGQTIATGTEPTILADQDGEFLLIADHFGIYRSSDHGRTWTNVTPETGTLTSSDGITLAQDDAGTVYAVHPATVRLLTVRSPDGVNWSPPFHTDVAVITDRPWLAARGDGHLALLYYDFGRTYQEYCLSSQDGGQTYTDRTVFTDYPPPNAGNALFGPDGALYWAVDGTLYQREESYQLARWTLCDGRTDSQELVSNPGDQVFTQVAQQGEDLWIGTPDANESRLVLASPTEGTLTFTPTDGEDRLRTNTFLALSGNETELAVAWYGSQTPGDPESDGFEGVWNVYVARISAPGEGASTDLSCESSSVSCHRLTDEPNHEGRICMEGATCSEDRELLDYFGVDHAPDGSLHVAYVHTLVEDSVQRNEEIRYACLGPPCPTE